MAREIEFVFRGDVSDLSAALKEAQGGLEETGQKAGEAGKKAKDGFNPAVLSARDLKVAMGAAATVAAALTATIVGTVKATIDLATELNQTAKEARQFGTTAEEIQRLDGALALLTDGSVRAAEVARFLGRNLANAADDGAGPAADALDKLNLSAEDLLSLPITEQVQIIGAGFRNLTSNGERTQVAMDLLGRAGTKLVAAFEQGPEAFDAALASIDEVGVVSNETAAQAEALTDAIELLERSANILKVDVLAPLIPVLTGVAEGLRQFLVEARDTGAIDEFARAVRFAFVDIALPASIALGQTMQEVFTRLEPVLKNAEAAARLLAASFLATTGQFEKSAEQLTKSKEAFVESVEASENMEATLAGQAEAWGALQDSILQAVGEAERAASTPAPRLGPGGGGGGGDGEDDRKRAEELLGLMNELASAAESLRIANLDGIARVMAERDAEIAQLRAIRDEALALAGEDAQARAQIQADFVAARQQVEAAALEELGAIRQAAHQSELDRIEAENQARQQSMQEAVTIANQMGGALIGLSQAIADAVVQGAAREGESREEAALRAFEANKATALISAGINTALAVVNALATAPNIIAGIALAAVAAAAGAVQIAIIGSQQPPTFHTGGFVTQGHRGALAGSSSRVARDEVPATLLTGEYVASRDEVRNGLGGSRSVTVVNKPGPRTTDAQIHEAVRTGRGNTARTFQQVKSRPVGRHRPYGGRG